jgi:hypothetical protein
MEQVHRVNGKAVGQTILAYTDTHLCYCPGCAQRLGYDDPNKWGPNWLPFIAITRPDEIPEKYCDSCECILERDWKGKNIQKWIDRERDSW